MVVGIPTTSLGHRDCYLDDIVNIFLGLTKIIKKNTALVPLTLHVLMRLLIDHLPVPRKKTLSLPKLEAK